MADFLLYTVESICVSFDRWGEEHVRGPGLYIVIVNGAHSEADADSLGENRWATETCRVVSEELDRFVEAARTVGFTRDGAVIISTDGTGQEQMGRTKSQSGPREDTSVDYADWMETKHLSAIEVSVRSEVVAAITFSEEDGRIAVPGWKLR